MNGGHDATQVPVELSANNSLSNGHTLTQNLVDGSPNYGYGQALMHIRLEYWA